MPKILVNNANNQNVLVDIATSADAILTPNTGVTPPAGALVETVNSALGSNQTINGVTNVYVPSATRSHFQVLDGNYTANITTPNTKTSTGWWTYYQGNSTGFNTTIQPNSTNTLTSPLTVIAGVGNSHYFKFNDNLSKWEWQKTVDNNRQALSVQQLNATGTVTNWDSIVEIGATALTANITLTLPICQNQTGKEITFKRLDNTAFTVNIVANGTDTTEITTIGSINQQFGALTFTCVGNTRSEQTANNNKPFVGANGTLAGNIGLVPTPNPTDNTKFLRGDGTWQTASSAIAITDSSSTGYIDIGTTRIQWGKASQTGSAQTPVTMPQSFLNTNYVVTLTPLGISGFIEAGSATISSVNQFSFSGWYHTGTASAYNNGRQYGWIAIGQKP
jgi:hypothetical protein